MIIDPMEFDREKYCTRYGYLTRLDGMLVMTPHDWGKWRKGKEVRTRIRECVICGISQVRETRDKRWKWPTEQKRVTGEKIVNLEDWRAS